MSDPERTTLTYNENRAAIDQLQFRAIWPLLHVLSNRGS